MSVQGPLLAILPAVSNQPVYAMSENAYPSKSHGLLLPNKHLSVSSPQRHRAVSVGESLDTLEDVPVARQRAMASLSPLVTTSANVARSKSLPRGLRGGSAEPIDPSQSLPAGSPSLRSCAMSSRFIRRAETIDTHEIRKEELEEHTRINQYKVLDIIGSGSFGIVRKATIDDDMDYAMKIVGKRRLRRKTLPVSPRARGASLGGLSSATPPLLRASGRTGSTAGGNSPLDNIRREIAILKKLDHPNVVKLIEVLDDPREDELILVFEYIPRGAVMSELPTTNTFDEAKAREYFIDIMLGLEFLHSQNIIHRDIKPPNLLLDDNDRIKIADFGVSEEIVNHDSHLSRSAGTPAFIAPECLDASKKTYKGQEVDIWAAGITLYTFIYGRVPWSSSVITDLHDKIKQDSIPLPSEIDITPELKEFLTRLLEKDPLKRMSIAEMREHPWILKSSRSIPSSEENCKGPIAVCEEDIKSALKPFNTPIHILVMIKQMAKRRSLAHPYSPKSSPRTSPRASPAGSPEHPSSALSERRDAFARTHNTPSIVVDSADL